MATPVFVSGIQGQVSVNGVPVAALYAWRMTKSTTEVLIWTFNTNVDGDGNVWPTALSGTSKAEVTFDGTMDVANPPDSGLGIRNGLVVTMSFLLTKAAPFGFNRVSVLITRVEIGTNVKDQDAKFSGSGVVSGSPGSTTTVTG